MYIAIDPGIKTGWCVLDAAGAVSVVGKGEGFPVLSNRKALIELPQVYPHQKKRVDPNNLITLAVRVGRYQERLEKGGVKVDLVLPTTWKGQVEKLIHHRRVDATLGAAERATVTLLAGVPGARGYSEDVWDAVALAKWGYLSKRFAH